MARWQLQCSGKAEEDHCKFCRARLPNWRSALFKDVLGDRADGSSDTAFPDGDGDSDASADALGVESASSSAPSAPGFPRRALEAVRTAASGFRPPAMGRARRPEQERTSVEDVSPTGAAAAAADSELGDVRGDIIVKFNDMSFRCKVRTGHEGLEDFMAQIREKCGIPEEKMRCLNLTYRCKDPNNGSQMTLQGVNESAFDAAVLCSAAQDKIKQRKRASRDGGRRRAAAAAPPPPPLERSFERRSPYGEDDRRSGDEGAVFETRPRPGSPGKSGRFESRDRDAASTRAQRRRRSLDVGPRASAGAARGPAGAASAAPASSCFRRGGRRLSAPPPSSPDFEVTSVVSADDDQPERQNRARRPWPSFMSSCTRSEA